MAFFQYKVKNTENQFVTGLVEAPSVNGAVRLLKDRKMFVVEISEKKVNANLSALLTQFQRVKFSDVVNFTRQLSTMINAGLQLTEALGILHAQMTNSQFAQVVADIEQQITSGSNLADALARYPNYFTDIYVALVRAGESSGMLDQVLMRLSENMEAQQEFRNKVKGAMIYPMIILIAMVAVMFIMMTVVIPKLTEMYAEFGTTLPWSTQLLMSISSFFLRFWWLMIGIMVGVFLGIKRARKSIVGAYIYDSIMLKIPLFGDLQTKTILTDFTRTLSMLVGSGIHILDGLKILQKAMGNVLFQNAIFEISKKVEKGYPLGEVFSQYEIFPPIVTQMMKVGEETGKLDETLLKVSVYFQSETEHLVKGLTTAIEPIIIVFLALGVGFIVFSIITPIYNLTSSF